MKIAAHLAAVAGMMPINNVPAKGRKSRNVRRIFSCTEFDLLFHLTTDEARSCYQVGSQGSIKFLKEYSDCHQKIFSKMK